MIRKLNNVDLVIIDDYNSAKKCEKVLDICTEHFDFENVIYLTNKKSTKYKTTKIPPLKSIPEYSEFVLKDLHNYLISDYCLIVQHDGYIKNPNNWTDEYYNYDYIGAVIPNLPATPEIKLNVVGNGGFSFRTKRLMEETSRYFNAFDSTHIWSEDIIICVSIRSYLMRKGYVFAPKEVANKFSIEGMNNYTDQFGFHGFGDKIYTP